ncbi:MAG: ATP-dependent RecD-like DNA helicase [Firmicutes bacterium]|nr:ATP-dependent RecD-like DNA helicase [Bacillota bacterium]
MSYIEGEIKQVLFYNDDNNYSVLKLDIIDTDVQEIIYKEPTIIICGFFPHLDKGQRYRFFGELKHHPKYGLQYDASRFERIMDNSREGLMDYLSSDLFKGIGPKTAEWIVDKYGIDCIDKILNDHDILDSVPRMSQAKKDSLVSTLLTNRKMETSLVWLYGFQISPKMAMKIYQMYGYESIDVIKENPYVLMEEIEGIGFKRADEIALKIGLSYNHPLRIKAVIIYLLNEYMNKFGDTKLSHPELLDFTEKYLNTDENLIVQREEIEDILSELVMQGKVIHEEDSLSLWYLYLAEKGISTSLKRYTKESTPSFDEELVIQSIQEFQNEHMIEYTEEQIKAIKKALLDDFLIITGGPGTGKTTIINGIVQIYKLLRGSKSSILLAAPTGKAAKRLKEATSFEATTIHRLLGYDYEGHFSADSHHPLTADLIIIDEASMLDVVLANHLFESIRSNTKVVIVGDDNQLPSVGPGQVLADLIESDMFNVVKLSKIHRQANDSSIISLAYDILNQHVSENLSSRTDDRKFIRSSEGLIVENIISVIHQAMEQGHSLHDDIQVLAPIYKGQNGIDKINEVIQERFNHQNQAHKISYNGKTFYFNDKVLQLANQPEDGIMNGDIGVVTGIIETKEMLVDFSGNVVKYNVKDFDKLTLAYCISIHKSQGSEFRIVILPLTQSYAMMLKRKLLYTAVTRAKEHLVMIGDYYALKRGVSSIETPRKTRLKGFLLDAIKDQPKKNLRIEDFL